MPIIFQDEVRRRARRRWLFGGLVGVALIVGAGIGSSNLFKSPEVGQSASPAPAEEVSSTRTAVSSDIGQAASSPTSDDPAIGERSNGCSTIDGDTLDCSGTRIRLLGVDAPEMPGHCRIGRKCVAGDPFRAAEALKEAVEGRDIKISVVGTDRYGRSLANIYVDGKNISCDLIDRGIVEYVERWDNQGLVARDCPNSSL